MKQLIDKSTLVAEIEKLMNHFKTCQTLNSYEDGLKEGRLIGYEDALYKINTLETKEVDLEKEKDDYWNKLCDSEFGELLERDAKWFDDIAKHFFELGLKAQKGEE